MKSLNSGMWLLFGQISELNSQKIIWSGNYDPPSPSLPLLNDHFRSPMQYVEVPVGLPNVLINTQPLHAYH